MTPNLVLIVTMAALFTAGVYLLLERSLTRVLVGILLLSNGISVLYMVISGSNDGAPIVGLSSPDQMSDPLPQAMVLTSIVITLGMTAFVLALAYRSWQLNRHDEVQDDTEDRRIVRLAQEDQSSSSYESDETENSASTSDFGPRPHLPPGMPARPPRAARFRFGRKSYAPRPHKDESGDA